MITLQQVKDALKNRAKIWEGLRNKTFKKEHIELIAEERLKICRANMCGYHDPHGTSEQAVAKGFESCGACGCRLDWKTRSLSSNCGLEVLNLEPLWTAYTTEMEAEMIKEALDKDEV